MFVKKGSIVVANAVALWLVSGAVHAAILQAVNIADNSAGPDFGGNFSVGWDFTVNQTITLDSLGQFDPDNTPNPQTNNVAIYYEGGAQIVQTTVLATNPEVLSGNLYARYANVAKVVLAPGNYVIFSQQNGDNFLAPGNNPSATFGTGITWNRGVALNGGSASDPLPVTAPTTWPIENNSPYRYFGPTFTYELGNVISSWNLTTGGDWNTDANWDNGQHPDGVDTSAVLGSTLSDNTKPVNISSSVTVGYLQFSNTLKYTVSASSGQSITLSGASGATVLDQLGSHEISADVILGSNTTVSMTNTTDTLTISGVISASGSQALAHAGPGTLTLTNANTYSGATNVTGGTLNLAHSLAVQNSTVNPSFGAAVSFAAGNTRPTFGGLAGRGNISLVTAASEPVALTVGSNGLNTINGGSLSGPGSLTKAGTGTLTMAAAQSYDGPTVINRGTLQLAGRQQTLAMTGWNQDLIIGQNELAPGYTMSAPGNWNFYEAGYNEESQGLPADSGATPRTFTSSYNSSVQFQFAPYVGNNAIFGNGVVALTTPGKFTSIQILDTAQGDATWTATLHFADGSSTTTSPMTNVDWTSGSQPNVCLTYYGLKNTNGNFYHNYLYMAEQDVTLSAADQAKVLQSISFNANGNLMVFAVSGSGAVGSNDLPIATPMTIAANGTLDLNGAIQQVASLSDGSGGGGSVVSSNTAAAAILTLSSTGGTTTFSGTIQGGGTLGAISLVIGGSGTQVLSSGNSFTGMTTISGGTLTLAHPLAVQNSTVTMTASGALNFAAGNTHPLFGGLAGAGNVNLASAAAESVTLSVGNNGLNTNFNGNVSGPGSLTKVGSGTLTLTASQSYTGPTVISNGTLKLLQSAGGQQPLALTGWNQDLIIGKNESTPVYSMTIPNGWDFYEAGYNQWPQGLPADSGPTPRTFTSSANPGVQFQFAPYAGNNAIYGSGMVTLTTPGMFQSIQILDTAQGNATWTATLNFADGSSTTTGPMTNVDWTNGSQPNVCLTNYGLHQSSDQSFYSNYLYMAEQDVTLSPADQAKVLRSVSINASGNLMVFALSGSELGSSDSLLPTATPLSVSTGGTLDLNGASQQVASLSDGSGGGGSIVNSNSATASVLTLSSTRGTTTFSGTIQGGSTLGAIRLVLSGSGTLILAGHNTYTGGTDVQGGTLVLASSDAIADGSSLTVGADAGSIFGSSVAASAACMPGVNPVPEPGTLVLLIVGLWSAVACHRFSRRPVQRQNTLPTC